MVIEVLRGAAPAHLTADEVWREVSSRYSDFNRSTAYRVLDLLSSAGVITQHRLGGTAAHYELNPRGTHHHLVCARCGRVFDLEPDELSALSRRVRTRLGFVVGGLGITVSGVCGSCLAIESAEQPAG
jgi:Fe2+ or Zn2+ uptake regulation protein